MQLTDAELQVKFPSYYDQGLRAVHWNGEKPFKDGYWETYMGRATFDGDDIVKCDVALSNGKRLEFWDKNYWFYWWSDSVKIFPDKIVIMYGSIDYSQPILLPRDTPKVEHLKKIVDQKIKPANNFEEKILKCFRGKILSSSWVEG